MASLEFKIPSGAAQAESSPALDKICGQAVDVYFVPPGGDTLRPDDYNSALLAPGDWLVTSWEIFGPENSELAAAGQDAGNFDDGGNLGDASDPLVFTPPLPGRYLIRLNAVVHNSDGAGGVVQAPAEAFTALYEVQDPQVVGTHGRGTSIIATNEKTEYDPQEGWSRSVERYLTAVSKIYGGRQFITATVATPGVVLGDIVTLVSSPNDLVDLWKSSGTGANSYNNYVMNVTEADLGGAGLSGPLYLTLEASVAADARSSFLMKGFFVMDTSGADVDDLVYLGPNDNTGPSLITETEATTLGLADTALRPVGHVMHAATDAESPPGMIYFDGTAEIFSTRLIAKLGLSILPTSGNPNTASKLGHWAKNTVWVDAGNSDQLMYGDAAVDSGGSSGSATLVNVDPGTNAVYNVTVNDFLIGVDCSTGIATGTHMSINLPAAALVGTGHRVIIKDSTGDCGDAAFDDDGGGIWINGSGSEEIDGALELKLNVQFASASIYCTGTGWSIY